jgi:hypothetical protein
MAKVTAPSFPATEVFPVEKSLFETRLAAKLGPNATLFYCYLLRTAAAGTDWYLSEAVADLGMRLNNVIDALYWLENYGLIKRDKINGSVTIVGVSQQGGAA